MHIRFLQPFVFLFSSRVCVCAYECYSNAHRYIYRVEDTWNTRPLIALSNVHDADLTGKTKPKLIEKLVCVHLAKLWL